MTDIPKPAKGKVRDIYDLDDKLLIVSTDRISAYDCILPNGIPGKGRILTGLSVFWFNKTSHLIQNHLITSVIEEYPDNLHKYKDVLEGRSMLVHKANTIPVECIVRGYITGSGWLDYNETTSICGIKLPANLKESDKLDKPVFTPTTKAEIGNHDENISFETMCEKIGKALAGEIKDLSIKIYNYAHDYSIERGIIIADTKFEFGLDKKTGQLMLIDEILTPDSSRFWAMDKYQPGRSQNSYDKQFVRDYLNSINWDRKYPAPSLPDHIVDNTVIRYTEVMRILTG